LYKWWSLLIKQLHLHTDTFPAGTTITLQQHPDYGFTTPVISSRPQHLNHDDLVDLIGQFATHTTFLNHNPDIFTLPEPTITPNHIHTQIIPGPANDYLRAHNQPPNLKLALNDYHTLQSLPNHPHHIVIHPVTIPPSPINFKHFARLYSTEPCFHCPCGARFSPTTLYNLTVCSYH
jgi:hypothetical protein